MSTSGALRGSVHGPLLFSLLIRDLSVALQFLGFLSADNMKVAGSS